MDTKTLHDWAVEADLNFKDEDYHDAIAVWVDAAMKSPEDLADYWVDWLVEDEEALAEIIKNLVTADGDLQVVCALRETSINFISTLSSSINLRLGYMGEAVRRAVRKRLEAFVEENADQWWSDVVGYHGDMLEGQYEDYQYEQARDRELDRQLEDSE